MKSVFCIKEYCMSCHQCEAACSIEHSNGKTLGDALTEPVMSLNRIVIRNNKLNNKPFPVKCRHCNPAPCISYCSTGALARDFSTGLVIVNEGLCTGCRACEAGCQFGAIAVAMSNVPGSNRFVAVKCDGCIDRVKRAGEPACVDSCKSGALVYSELDDDLKKKRRSALEESAALNKRYQTQ